MLISPRFRDGIESGAVTLTFRRWKRCQVVAGHRYRTAAGRIEVDAVAVVDPRRITNADARKAGFPNQAALLAELRGTDELPTYRIRFHAYRGTDERAELQRAETLSADDLADIDRRLARLDKASSHGPWTMAVLRVIDEHPRTRAGDLAPLFGRELQPFKLDVRKLKNLGLTISHEIGYELSPRVARIGTPAGPLRDRVARGDAHGMDVRSIRDVEPEVEHNGTVPVWYLVSPREMKEITNGGYLELVNEFEVAAGGHVFPHTHPTHEFYFVMSGRGVMTIDGEDQDVAPGDLVYIPPDLVHSLRPTGGGAIHCFCFAVAVKDAPEINYTSH